MYNVYKLIALISLALALPVSVFCNDVTDVTQDAVVDAAQQAPVAEVAPEAEKTQDDAAAAVQQDGQDDLAEILRQILAESAQAEQQEDQEAGQ